MGPALLPAQQTTASAAETIIPVQFSPDGRAELQRRLSAHQAAPSSSIPWQQVRGERFKRQA